MKTLLQLSLVFLLLGCQATTRIFIVRHGEKSAPSGNVPLSGEGLQRAETYFGLDTMTYANGDSLMKVLIGRRGKNYLVVGHSNTVPQMIRAIGLQPGFEGNIPDGQYDNLFEITVKRKETQLLVKKYGLRNN